MKKKLFINNKNNSKFINFLINKNIIYLINILNSIDNNLLKLKNKHTFYKFEKVK